MQPKTTKQSYPEASVEAALDTDSYQINLLFKETKDISFRIDRDGQLNFEVKIEIDRRVNMQLLTPQMKADLLQCGLDDGDIDRLEDKMFNFLYRTVAMKKLQAALYED